MGARVLIVDDEQAIVEGLMLICEAESIESEGAEDRVSAAELVRGMFYPVIVADLCLRTTKDGLQLLDDIRRLSPRSRVVTLSGYVTPEMHEEVTRRGVSVVLHKTESTEVIINTILELLAEIEREADADPGLDLEALYLKVQKVLYSIPRRKYGLAHDAAEDIAQQAWLLFLERRTTVRDPRTWLSGTAVNLCRQELHRSRRIAGGDPAETFESLPTPDTSDRADVMALRQALHQLDERSRDLCEWIGLEGYSYDEVSNATALPAGSIGPLYIRAKKKLRDALTH